MNKKILFLMVLMSGLVLLVSACDAQADADGIPVEKLPAANNEVEVVQPAVGGNTQTDAVQGANLQEGDQDAVQHVAGSDPGSAAQVNQMAGEQIEIRPTDQPDGLESSQAGPVAPVVEEIDGSVIDQGDPPTQDERDAMLDGSNLAPPVIKDDTGSIVAGPPPGPGSGLAQDSIVPVPAPGSEANQAIEVSPEFVDESQTGFMSRFLATLSNWLQSIFSQ